MFFQKNTMSRITFSDALDWHMDRHGTTIVELVEGSKVSRHVINKLRARPKTTTSVENGMQIAAYYGKTVEQFMRMEDVEASQKLANLVELLLPEERASVRALVQGLMQSRE